MWVRLGQSRLEETWNSFIERQQTFLEGRAGKIQRQMGRQEEEIAVMPKVGWLVGGSVGWLLGWLLCLYSVSGKSVVASMHTSSHGPTP
jgi:hypothetical protein